MKGYLEEPRRVYKYQNTSIRRAVVLTRWAEPAALPNLSQTWREVQHDFFDRERKERNREVLKAVTILAFLVLAMVAGCQWAVM